MQGLAEWRWAHCDRRSTGLNFFFFLFFRGFSHSFEGVCALRQVTVVLGDLVFLVTFSLFLFFFFWVGGWGGGCNLMLENSLGHGWKNLWQCLHLKAIPYLMYLIREKKGNTWLRLGHFRPSFVGLMSNEFYCVFMTGYLLLYVPSKFKLF